MARTRHSKRDRPPGRSSDPGALRRRLEKGLSAQRAGHARTAQGHYKAVLAKEPRNFDALHLLGTLHLLQGELTEAHRLIDKALKVNPEFPEAHNNLGQALQRLGRLDEAIRSYRQALALNPRHVTALRNLGAALRESGRLDEAVDAFQRAIVSAPYDATLRHALGTVLQSLGQTEEALECYRVALQLKPDATDALHSMGVAYQERSMLREARSCYEKALETDPAHTASINNLAILRDYDDRPAEDLEQLHRRSETEPDDVDAWLQLGVALWQQEKFEAADEALHRAWRCESTNGRVAYYLGLVRRDLGDLQQAETHFKRALELDDGAVLARSALANLAVAPSSSPRGLKDKRVAFHLAQPYHYSILRPVFDALSGHCDCFFAVHLSELVRFNPNVVVVAESQSALLRARLPDAAFVWVRHGLISKNTTCYAARSADYACLTSEESRAWYIAHGGKPRRGVWVSGYAQMDPLFRRDPMPLPFSVEPGNHVVLYAPTWTPGLSSGDMMGARTAALIRGERNDITVVIKPHPVTRQHRPQWLQTWRALASTEPAVHVVDDPTADVTPYLRNAEVLVTDASSVMFQYLAVDRPIVLITNPSRHQAAHFDPMGIEWQWRDVGQEVERISDLAACVSEALDDPSIGAERRAHYRERLFGGCTDGRAAERIAAHIAALLH